MQSTGEMSLAAGKESVSFLDMFSSLSTALDLVNPRLGDHHKLTCYIASHIARELDWPLEEYEILFGTALIHDIGASSLTDRLDILEFETNDPHDHALMGEAILEAVKPMAEFAPHVGDHHVLWADGAGEMHRGREVSRVSHLVQLADRVAVLIDRNLPLITQSEQIRSRINDASGRLFHPEFVEAFCDVAANHEFWLEMEGAFLENSIASLSTVKDRVLTIGELEDLARVYAFIIDTRSRFTASHSSGVAVVAEALAEAHGLDAITCKKIKVSGYLHDIGKLSVPSEILEKNGKLDDEERLIIKGHSFYTRKIIASIRGMEQIGAWAANHHEFVDGSGYPFGYKGEELDVESRVLTVADIFTALTESRPYREGMGLPVALGMLENFVQRGQLDENVFQTLVDNAESIDELRSSAQEIEAAKMASFWDSVSDRIRENEL